MRIYRKWNIITVVLLAILVGGWLYYTNTNEFRVRRLVTELLYLRERPHSPTFGDQIIFVASLTRPNTRSLDDIIDELNSMGESAFPPLIDALKESDWRTGMLSAVALSCMAPRGAEIAVPALIKATADNSPKVRKWAAIALGNYGPVNDKVVPSILAIMTDEDQAARVCAIRALSKMGCQERDVISALKQATQDNEVTVRHEASLALKKILEGKKGS